MATKGSFTEKEGCSMSEPRAFSVIDYFKQHDAYLRIFLIFLSVGVALAILYSLDPQSFDKTFNGRAYYLFFVWLVVLELALDWDKYKVATKMSVKRMVAFGLALALPTCYVVVANFFGLNSTIKELTRSSGIIPTTLGDYADRLNFTPLAAEFIVFAVLFAVIILCAYKWKGLADFSLAVALLGVVGGTSLTNLLAQTFAPFQILVPTTAALSSNVLGYMGYVTLLQQGANSVPVLYVQDPATNAMWSARIAWPCAGVESLLLYTIIMLLFLKKADMPRLHKVIYFAIGAGVTYFINILRIATLFIIAVNGGDWATFHDYYGQFYSAIWIMFYPLLIIGIQTLSKAKYGRIRNAIMHFITDD